MNIISIIVRMIKYRNLREVFMGNSMKEFNDARETLELKGIKYVYRLDSRGVGIASSISDKNFSVFYYIYVHKDDSESAKFLLRV